MSSDSGAPTSPAAAAATSAKAADAAAAARVVLIGGWRGERRSRSVGREGGSTDRATGGWHGNSPRQQPVPGVVIMIHNSDRVGGYGLRWKTKVDVMATHVTTTDMAPNANMDFHHK